MKKNLKRIFYLIVLSLLAYAPNAMAVACYGNGDSDLIINNGSSEIIIDGSIPNITSTIVLIIKIAVPVLLVIMGMVDLGKGVIAQKEDEIKKGQQMFIKRLVAGLLVFFAITIVQMLINFADNDRDGNVMGCAKCFLNGIDRCNGGQEVCSSLGFSFTITDNGYIYPDSLSFNGLDIERVESPFSNAKECMSANANDYTTIYDSATKTFKIEKAFKYISCSLNGYEFDLRNDGHIPGASVYGNGIIEAYDVQSEYKDGSKCPSQSEYKASYANGTLYITREHTYINCTLDGYEFQLRNDGHIPGASVYGNGVDETWDTKSEYKDGSKCPSSSQYKASVTSDGVFVITKK